MIIKKGNIILMLLFITFLSSCGVFKSVFRSSSKDKEKIESSTKIDESNIIEDKSVKVVKEYIDTTFKIDYKQYEDNSEPINDLKDIKGLTVLSNDLVIVRQTYDTLSKRLKTTVDIKPQEHRFKYNKTTTTNNNIKNNTTKKIDSTFKKEIKIKNSEVKREPKNIFWLVVLGLGVISIFSYFTYRYFKK